MGLAGIILAAGESSRMGQDKALLPWPPLTHSSNVAKEPTLGSLGRNANAHVGPDAPVRAGEPGSPLVAAQGAAGRVRAPAPTRSGDFTAGVARVGSSSSGTLLSKAIEALGGYCDLVIVVAGNNEPALRPVVYACGAFLVRNAAPERGQFSSLQTGLHEVLSRGHDNAMVTLVDRPAPESRTLVELVSSFASRGHNCWAVVPEFGGKHGHPILIGREMIEQFLKAPAIATARDIEHANQDRISYVRVDDPLVTMNINTHEDYASLQSQT